ncbi:aggrecan core protein [Engraulis encrasicolus]|uniref:aggrecan core protein n=1 Tax=Engraulis encrasicolus TaxID=184585 RepID=UPI002FD503C2
MWALFVGLTFGILASARSDDPKAMSRSCSLQGVSHVEGSGGRYTLTYEDAKALCESLNTELATEEQIETAYNSKMETCRYGWTANMSVAILRHTAREQCYLNKTGLSVKKDNNTGLYDAYCYDSSDISEQLNCASRFNNNPEDPNGTTTGNAEEATRGLDDPLTFLDDVVATADPAQHENFTNVEESTDIPQPASSEEGVFSERVFTSDAPSDEDQGTATTQVTSVLLPDDSTGSGIQPTSEEPEVTQPTELPVSTTEVEPEQQPEHKPEPELEPETEPEPETKPERRPDTVNTVPPVGRNVNPEGTNEERKDKSGNDWLVIIGVVVAVAAILLVCGIVATRKRWCGKHQSLNISKGGSGNEGNGAAAGVASSRAEEREQEMVTLMNKEKIQENGNADELTAITVDGSSEKA